MANKKNRGNNLSDDEIRYYLEAYGIHCISEETTDTHENMTKSGYKEIPYSHIGQIGMLFQQLPGLAANTVSYHGTYRVYFDKSLGVLQQAKQGDGFLRANVVQAGTNNKITGQALLKAASAGPLVANVVFSALSMVTGQYFLSEINGQLSEIDKKIDGIQQFLENEKRSELLSNHHFLEQIIKTLEFIQSNEYQKQATINQLQRIRLDSFTNLNFYSTAFQQKKTELIKMKANSRKNFNSIPAAINKIGDIVLLYKFALYTYSYSLAYYIEILLSGNMDSSYIDYIRIDINNKTNDYTQLVKYFSSEMETFINNTKAYDANMFLDLARTVLGASASELLLGSSTLGESIAEAINSKSDEAKKKAKTQVINQVKALIRQCSDYTPFIQIDNNLKQYDQIINNSKLVLVCMDDKTYIKFSEADTEQDEDKKN